MANYPLKELYYATDNVTDSQNNSIPPNPTPRTSLLDRSGDNGNNPIKVSDFVVGSVASLESTKNFVSYGDIFTIYVQFASENSRFNKIKNIRQNYQLGFNTGSYLETISENPPFFTYKNIYAGPNADTGNTALNFQFNITFFDDSFNENATNYGIPLTKTVNLYSPPQPTVILTHLTRPPKCCRAPFVQYQTCAPSGCGDATMCSTCEADKRPTTPGYFGCCGASFRVTWNSTPYQGVSTDFTQINIVNISPLGGARSPIIIDNLGGLYSDFFDVVAVQGSNEYQVTITNQYGKKSIEKITTMAYV